MAQMANIANRALYKSSNPAKMASVRPPAQPTAWTPAPLNIGEVLGLCCSSSSAINAATQRATTTTQPPTPDTALPPTATWSTDLKIITDEPDHDPKTPRLHYNQRLCAHTAKLLQCSEHPDGLLPQIEAQGGMKL
jgi:hypothetical protein